MKNKIFNFEILENDDYRYRDMTDKKLIKFMNSETVKDEDYFTYVDVLDDTTIESISFELYETTDYWDILAVLNNMNPLYDMPKNYDLLHSIADEKARNFIKINSSATEASHYDLMFNIYLGNLEKDNEKFRKIKVVQSSKIDSFLRSLRYEGIVL